MTPDVPLSTSLPGTSLLESCVDVTASGDRRTEPSPGEDPVARLIYDRAGHFSAQFMKRDRSAVVSEGGIGATNDTRAQGGYDAYLGTHVVDDAANTVTQRRSAPCRRRTWARFSRERYTCPGTNRSLGCTRQPPTGQPSRARSGATG